MVQFPCIFPIGRSCTKCVKNWFGSVKYNPMRGCSPSPPKMLCILYFYFLYLELHQRHIHTQSHIFWSQFITQFILINYWIIDVMWTSGIYIIQGVREKNVQQKSALVWCKKKAIPNETYINVPNEVLAFECRLFQSIMDVANWRYCDFSKRSHGTNCATFLWMGQNTALLLAHNNIDHVD